MQNLIQNADYLVCLTVETTSSPNNLRRLFATPHDRLSQLSGGAKQESAPAIGDLGAFLAQNSAVVPRVLHMDWCVCSVKDFKVLESANSVVNPGTAIDAASAAQTKVTQELVNSQGVTLQQALEKMTASVNSVVGSGKYRICSFGDWPVRYALALDALRCGTALPETLTSSFVNVVELHYDQNTAGPHVSTIEELLRVHELEPISSGDSELKAKSDGASLVRVLNRMIRTFKTRFDGQGMATLNESTEESKPDVKRRSRSRSRENMMSTDAAAATQSGEPKSIGDVNFSGTDMVALKMRGLPWRVEVEEIEQFFSRYAYIRDSVRIGELADGRKTGQATVLFETADEASNAMTERQGQNVGSRWVELYQMPYSQYETFAEDQLNQKTVNLKNFLNEENLHRCVKLRGIPYQASQDDVKNFFADFNVNDDDIVIEMRQGKKTGFALVFLNGEDDVQRARQELNKQYIGSRFIDVMIPRLEE